MRDDVGHVLGCRWETVRITEVRRKHLVLGSLGREKVVNIQVLGIWAGDNPSERVAKNTGPNG